MGRFKEKELVGTGDHALTVVPSNLLFKDSSQNQLFGVNRDFVLRDRSPDGNVFLA
jgi:hypothetical protein